MKRTRLATGLLLASIGAFGVTASHAAETHWCKNGVRACNKFIQICLEHGTLQTWPKTGIPKEFKCTLPGNKVYKLKKLRRKS